MYEMRDVTEQGEPEFEPRSRSVSFPDHYLLPYIEMCKRSKPITCCWIIIFIGLAIYCFFATNYMIDYPVTEARKIAFVFAGIFCLVAAASCLNLRFGILQQFREGSFDNVQFEMTRRDIEFTDSFSGHFETQETSFCHGTPKEKPNRSERPEDSISQAHTIDDPCFANISTFRYNGRANLPRHSISDGMTLNTPLLPQKRTLEPPRPSEIKNGIGSNKLPTDSNKNPPNYSTFSTVRETFDTEPLLAESTFQNGCEAHETEPLLAKSTFQNGCEAHEAEPLLAESMFRNGCESRNTEPLSTESAFQSDCEAPDNEPLLAEST